MPKVQVVKPMSIDRDRVGAVQFVWEVPEMPAVGSNISDSDGQPWKVVSVVNERDGFLETIARIEVEPAERV